jgi:eukaryotic-like serine/threonine-protein kinase
MQALSDKHDALIAAARQQVLHRDDGTSSASDHGGGPAPAFDVPGYRIGRGPPAHRGGQGVVYRAVQESTGRSVAVKFMGGHDRPFASAHDRARFEREIQILGQLNHPNIVRIIDSGEADGQHYFVMDYVDGVPLDEYGVSPLPLGEGSGVRAVASGDERSWGAQPHPSPLPKGEGVSLEDKLLLFANVCDAVHAAHLHGVIHRDLKPGNILVDSAGRPHVLDFGLAKLFTLDPEADADGPSNMTAMTETGQFLGSLPWASPEQVSGNAASVDIRSDVYSLGVVLYQLLTAEFPYQVTGSIREITGNILSAVPARCSLSLWERVGVRVRTKFNSARGRAQPWPGSRPPARERRTTHAIDDEVETIVLKTLSKEPERRYQSAGDLARDIRRYLAGEVIEAKRDSLPYVLRKQLRRYWIPASVAAAFVVVVTAGLIVSLNLWSVAAHERDQHEAQRRRAESVNAVLHNMLASANPEISQGRELTVAEVLGAAASEIDAGSLREHPDVEASVRLTLGEAYLASGKLELAEHHLQAALALGERVHGRSHRDTALCLAALGRLRTAQADLLQAATLLQEALDILQIAVGESSPEMPSVMLSLATALSSLERLDAAAALRDQALALVTRRYGEQHPETARLRIAIATNTYGSERGVELLREELEINRDSLGPRHPETLRTLRQLGAELHLKGQIEEAERTYLDALRLSHEVHGPAHPDIISLVMNLEWLYRHTKQTQKLCELLREYEPAARATYGAESVRYAEYLNSLGASMVAAQNRDEAAVFLQRGLDTLKAIGRDQSWQGAESRVSLASIALRRGDDVTAERLAREILAIENEQSERMDVRLAQAKKVLGEVLLQRGEFAQAEPLLLESFEALRPRATLPQFRINGLELLVRLYEAWDAAEPGRGHDQQAMRWRDEQQKSAESESVAEGE